MLSPAVPVATNDAVNFVPTYNAKDRLFLRALLFFSLLVGARSIDFFVIIPPVIVSCVLLVWCGSWFGAVSS